MPYLQRKYIDLIRHVSSKWVNWDPPIPVEVGAYGEIEPETGELRVEGNVYDAEFQSELQKLGVTIQMADHPPQETDIEEDVVIASKGARRVELSLSPEANIAGIASASIKGQWQFERGKRDALLIMHRPRIKYIPADGILEKLYKVPKLKDKWLVANVHVCPAFSMYLSNKCGEKISLALMGQVPVVSAVPGVTAGGEGGVGWWSDAQADLLRKGCDKTGKYCFTPLYTMKRRITWLQRIFRQEEIPVTGDNMWEDAKPPWDPLDEDGEEDILDLEMQSPQSETNPDGIMI